MTFKLNPVLLLILVFFLFCTQAMATHEANEPTDGTVNSFRWLESPLLLGDVPIHNEAGKQISLSQFHGKIVLLNLWASWCPPCVRELPALDRLQQRLGVENFAVVAVSLDKNPEFARKMFIERLSIRNLDFYIEPVEQIGRIFPVDVLPANFFIDRKGQVVGILRSFVDWGDHQADTLIKRLIAGEAVTALRAGKVQSDTNQ